MKATVAITLTSIKK